MSKTANRMDRLQAAHDKLQQAVESIVSGEDWQRMLQTAAKFHRYSFHNQLLIFLQRPDATLVAGFHKWKSMGRFVKKGERGIAIFAPCKYKTKIESDDGEEQTLQEVRGFRVVYVWDISQTDGDPIPDLDAVRPKLLSGDAPDGIWDALVGQAHAAGFEVVRDQKRSENGYCDFGSGRIGIRPHVEDLQAVKTLVHELAHALLHAEEIPENRARQEVEVESVAFVVLEALGLASDDYSFPYVARWAEGDMSLVKTSADRAVTCASTILRCLEQEHTGSAL